MRWKRPRLLYGPEQAVLIQIRILLLQNYHQRIFREFFTKPYKIKQTAELSRKYYYVFHRLIYRLRNNILPLMYITRLFIIPNSTKPVALTLKPLENARSIIAREKPAEYYERVVGSVLWYVYFCC